MRVDSIELTNVGSGSTRDPVYGLKDSEGPAGLAMERAAQNVVPGDGRLCEVSRRPAFLEHPPVVRPGRRPGPAL
jgi:hypothetical protein